MTARSLLAAHLAFADRVHNHDLQVQHLTYHPSLTAAPTQVHVELPSWPDAFLPWCDALGIASVRVRQDKGTTGLIATRVEAGIQWRVSTRIAHPGNPRSPRLPGSDLRWDSQPPADRSTPVIEHHDDAHGSVSTAGLRVALKRLGITTPAHVAG